MKPLKVTDLRVQTPDELMDGLLQLKKEQFNLRFQQASGQLENTARKRQVRRDIAKIQTVMAERNRAEAAAEAKG